PCPDAIPPEKELSVMATTTTQRRTVGEPTLAARLRSGDPAAFEDLYRNHHQHVTRYVTARLAGHDRDAVDDLVQDTFCAATTDRSVNTVRTLQRRALHHLKQQLAGADSNHPA